MRDARLVARFLPIFPKFSQAYNAPLLLSLAAFVCLLSICSAHQAQTAPPAGACPSVLIVGASGYIGSFLFEQLRRPSPLGCNATVTGVSRSPSAHMSSQGVQALDCRQLSTEFLSSFDVVLYLGGLSSRVGCSSADWDEVVNQNVNSIASLASRMHQAQLLIFASTSAIADGLNHTASDDDHGDEASLDAYALSMLMRERRLRHLSETSANAPHMIGLRFGTTIGISTVQRTNLFAVAFARAIAESGFMRVMSPLSVRPVLHLGDLSRLIRVIIAQYKQARRFDVFNVASFHSSMSRFANEMSAISSAPNFETPAKQAEEKSFRVNCSRLESVFAFKFIESIESTAQELHAHSEQLSTSTYKAPHNLAVNGTCVVCGGTHLQSALDLGSQPLANAFVSEPDLALQQPQYPLHLVSCPRCRHVQLSTTVDRSLLFKHYLYASGTSRTAINYFKWFAQKVTQESRRPTAGVVIEIAHNDGSQLDQFSNLGWATHGVDPAENLAATARARGHVVHVAFWGTEPIPDLPAPDDVDAIIAQNVAAHVENVTQFMVTCAAAMGPHTRLYIQTSQCEMFETGQFDTVYHEHVSFFTAHSFNEAARLADLDIVNFETTPIHGKSCLVTFMKATKGQPRELPVPLQVAMDQEVSAGLKDGRLMAEFKREAVGTRTWMHDQLQSLAGQGFKIVAYGAAAKGMVLLHFLRQLQRSYDFDFVVDDAPLKQGTYCPGTSIPVLPAANISTVPPNQPLAIVIMPWNFLEEITFRIQNLVQFPRSAPVILVVPFPRPKLLLLHPSDVPTEILPPTPPKLPLKPHSHVPHIQVVLLAEISSGNAVFIHNFIQHHASMFDAAVILDHSDGSFVQSAFDAVAPSNWRLTKDSNVIASSLFKSSFGDQTTWAIRLHGHQLLVHPDFRAFIREFNASSLHFPVVQLSEKTSGTFSSTCLSTLCKRTHALRSTIEAKAPIKRAPLLSFAASSLESLLHALSHDAAGRDVASASASEGFVAELRVANAGEQEEEAGLRDLADLSHTVGEWDVMQQAHKAWFQVHNRILRLGCRGCSKLRSKS